MSEYTPEKVAELVADTRDHADYMRRVWGDDAEAWGDARLFDRLADALAAVSAERDELRAVIADIRTARSNHPTCNRIPVDDVVTCGWKNAVLDIDAAVSRTRQGRERR